jgi:hypothetical protein
MTARAALPLFDKQLFPIAVREGGAAVIAARRPNELLRMQIILIAVLIETDVGSTTEGASQGLGGHCFVLLAKT